MMERTLPRPPGRARVLVLGAVALAFLGACVPLPRLEETLARAERLAESSMIYAKDGTLITALHDEQNREIIPLDQVPVHVRQAIIAIEDERFFEHPGIDLRAVARAFLRNTSEGKVVQGGSTITQQYIKNALITRQRTLKGKIQEAALAYQLEQRYSKEEILGLYLNAVYFGQGAYGIEAAAQTFFGRHAKEISVAQGALLAGLIKSPSRFDPYVDPEAGLARRNLVIQRMREQGYLSEQQASAATRTKLGLQPARRVDRYQAAYFVEYLKDLVQRDSRFEVLGKTIGERINALFKGGLRIHTTIDLRLQKIAEDASRKVLPYKRDPHNAFVALDSRTGAILAMVGGRDFFDPKDPYAKFNLAVQSRRQPGSSFKTFTLVAALEEGIPLERVYRGGSVIRIPLPTGETWTVHNYESLSFGSRLSLREATIKSVNVVYAQLVMQVGAKKVVEVARRMGITSRLTDFPSIAIGAQEVSPLEMASAYAPLANGGYAVPPVAITRITDSAGKVLYEWKQTPKRVLTPAVVALAVDALKDVILRGTGRRQQLGRPVAGKTGTADEFHDAWFGGFVPQMVAVSWIGFPRAQIPMYPPYTRIKVVGGSWPGQIWKLFMQEALKGVPPEDFPFDEKDLIRVEIDVTRNCLPNDFTSPALIEAVVYLRGTEPTRTCTEPTSGVIASTPNVIGKSRAEAQRILGEAGFVVGARLRSCPTYPVGYVCDQDPPPGARGAVGDAATIHVSDDRAVATVPIVLGKTLAVARKKLHDAGFDVVVYTLANPEGSVDYPGCRDPSVKTPGRVWLQNPCAGEQIPTGSLVRIYVNPS